MKPEFLGDLADKLENLLARLPAPLRKPVLQELDPLKELFLRQRPVRFAIAGAPGIPADLLLARLFGSPIQRAVNPPEGLETPLRPVRYERPGGGAVEISDLRESGFSLADVEADLCLFFHEGMVAPDGAVPGVADLERWVAARKTASRPVCRVIAFLMEEHTQGRDLERERIDFHTALLTRPPLEALVAATFHAGHTNEAASSDAILYIYQLLPNEARLEMARFSGAKEAQKVLAATLVKSVTAVCAAIGAQPIPLADLPVLTSCQAGMVAGIVHLSGRRFSMKLAAEFLATIGANVGIGIVLRETSRALLKFFPGWGNLISGALAAAGTYAVGRAATAYFIEGVPMPKVQSLFQSLRKRGRKDPEGFLKETKVLKDKAD